MEAADLDEIKNIPVHVWLPLGKLNPDLREKLELDYLIECRKYKFVQSWSSVHKGFVDIKLPVNEFRIKHRILEVYDRFYICTQSPVATSIYAFYCGRCVSAGDREAVLVEVTLNGIGRLHEAIEEVKEELLMIKTIKQTKKIRLY